MIKKAFSTLFLAAVLVFCLMPMAYAADAGLDNFQRSAVYTQGQFTDVATNSWYAESVKTGYEMGLIKGSSATTYNPTGNITIAEAITLAARLHSIYYTGEANFGQSDPWYKVYTDYAISKGIIKSGAYADYSARATRGQFALIFAAAFPDSALAKINNVATGSLPDVVGNETYGPAVYKLYNAGILAGNDEYGTFKPASNIQRSEVAAIVTRMADTGLRKIINLKVAVNKIQLSETAVVILTGDTIQLTATLAPENAVDKTVGWQSSNDAVAKVDKNGNVIGIAIGTATITATTANGLTATCSVNVNAGPVAVTGISLDKTALSMSVNSSYNLTATISPFDAADKTIIWNSDDKSIVKVNDNGVVTALKVGKATITAKTSNGLVATCTVADKPTAYDFLVSMAKTKGTYDKYINCYEYRYASRTSSSGITRVFDLVYSEKDRNILFRSISSTTNIEIFTVEIPSTPQKKYNLTLAYSKQGGGSLDAWLSVLPATYTSDTLPTIDEIYNWGRFNENDIRKLCREFLNLNLYMAEALLLPYEYSIADLGFNAF